jgi:hypothetical protein
LNTPSLVVVALVPLIAWRIYKRVRRNIGRQKSRLWRHWAGTVLCPLLLAMFALAASRSTTAEVALLLGIAGGIAAGVAGLKLTRFEGAASGWFYTPNPYLGIGLSLLLIGRVVYRFYEIYGDGGMPHAQRSDELARSPLTLFILGLVFAYYAAYSFGLLRWRRRMVSPSEIGV